MTFHKAIDETNVLESLNVLTRYPQITNILTAGGKNGILNHLDVLKEMVESTNTCHILFGGGLTLDTYSEIKEITTATHFHFGTAVHENKSSFHDIDCAALCKLVNRMNNHK